MIFLYFRHHSEAKCEELLVQRDDHDEEEVLIEMRLQDVEHMKKEMKLEQKRNETLKKEDCTESEESESDGESEAGEVMEPFTSSLDSKQPHSSLPPKTDVQKVKKDA